jgi:hypothetical protein
MTKLGEISAKRGLPLLEKKLISALPEFGTTAVFVVLIETIA